MAVDTPSEGEGGWAKLVARSLTRDLRGDFWCRSDFEASLARVVANHVVGVVLGEEEGENVTAVEGGCEVERGLAARVGDVDRGGVMLVDEFDSRDWSNTFSRVSCCRAPFIRFYSWCMCTHVLRSGLRGGEAGIPPDRPAVGHQ